jgi:predicted nucleic acid-binding Zn ribbon protein
MVKEQFRRTPRGYDGTQVTSQRLAPVLSQVLSKINAQHKERPDLLLAYWPQIVGPTIAPLTQAVSFQDGVLTVKVKNSTLYSLLSRDEKPKIIRALRLKFPNITLSNIYFKIG